jgi:dTMP kinase
VAGNPRDSAARGYFVTFEGPEGAGKTTQAERLLNVLLSQGGDAILVREPGGTPAGEHIRRLLLDADPDTVPISARTDALLFNAARAELVGEVILPALARGRMVICSRFADSTLAYQGYGMGLPLDDLRGIEAFATRGFRPDLTILLDVPVEVGLARKRGVEETRFEASFDVEFHRRVRAGFLALAAGEPGRFVVIDGQRAASAVFADVVAAVERVVGSLSSK